MTIEKLTIEQLKNVSFEDLKLFFENQLREKQLFDEWEYLKEKEKSEELGFYDLLSLTQLDNHFKNY